MTIGPIHFVQPVWLGLFVLLGALTVALSARSLAGLGPRLRVVVVIARLLVLLAICGAMAEPEWRREAEGVAVIAVVDTSKSMPESSRGAIVDYLSRAAEDARPDDRLGIVTTANDAFARELPTDRRRPEVVASESDPSGWLLGTRDATDLASGIRLALAMAPEDRATRIIVYSDGNETSGSLVSAAQTAAAAGVPIDVIPEPYDVQREVIFDHLVAPATARRGQTVRLRFVLSARTPVTGRLSLSVNDEPVDLTPDEEGISTFVALDAGKNVVEMPVTMSRGGPQVFRAVFEPDDPALDTIVQNNNALSVTFVGGEGKVLVCAPDLEASVPLVRALDRSGLETLVVEPAGVPTTLIELQLYDAIVLFDTPAWALSFAQQEQIASYVHDSGGGLMMVGGPSSFGAGGWLGTPLAEVLPVKLDPPDRKQMPRGALALIMHSTEIPDGVHWGKQTGVAAINSLSRLDLVGVLEYDWGANSADGVSWVYPIQEKSDGTRAIQAVNNLSFGDMPDFDATMVAALNALRNVRAGQKHVIIISDGDPSGGTGRALLKGYVDAKVTVSTVACFPHQGDFGSLSKMKKIANATGGNYYQITSRAQLGQLPQIFIKEAQTVRRSLIWEGDPVAPAIVDASAEPLRGLGGALPPLTGYVVTADRGGLSQVTVRGPQDDPIVAMWQYGLGRVVAFTSDATSRWDSAWLGWSGFRSFWDQHVRWMMRPTGSANLEIITEAQGERTRVIVTALTDTGEPVNFARFESRVTGPDLEAGTIDLAQTGPGRYEGVLDTAQAGAYLATISYSMQDPESGATDRGFALAAITRPFADEYRALKDNAGLLRQAAEITGGRTLPTDPADAELFSREALTMPVSLRPVWIAAALIGVGLFLLDVAVRRVRLDLVVIRSLVGALSRRERVVTGAEVGALRAAREKASRRTARGTSDAKRTRRFEAPADGAPGRAPADPVRSGAAPPSQHEMQARSDDEDEEQGIGRLLRAKRRAQQQMRDSDTRDTRD